MWVLRGFDRDTEELITEIELIGVPPEMVRELWDLPRSDPGYDSYPATEDRLALLIPYVRGGELNADRLDYFLEFAARDR